MAVIVVTGAGRDRDNSSSEARRYRLDPSTRLVAGSPILTGGSPLRLFRLTPGGRRRYDAIASGIPVSSSRLIDRLVAAGAIHPVARAAPERLAETTVVIPTYNGDHRRVSALVAACGRVARVIVVDDGSSPPVGPIAGAELVRIEVNGGPAAARNAGLEATSTDYVAFVDDDIVIDEIADDGTDWLADLLGHFDDPTVGAIAPRVRSSPGIGQLARYEEAHSPLDLGGEPAMVAPGARISYVPAAVLVVRRGTLDAVGGFDTSMRWGEDVDAVWRMIEQGMTCRYEPAVQVCHEPRRSWRAWALQRFRYGSSAAPLERQHPGALAPVRVTGWSVAVWLLAAAGARRSPAALGLSAYTAVALDRRIPDLGWRESVRLTALGHLHAGRLLAAAVRRVWWPIAAAGALRSRRIRWIVAISCAAVLADDRSRRPSPRRATIRILDDLCYGAGVWAGVIGHREIGPLTPRVISWPGRSPIRSAS